MKARVYKEGAYSTPGYTGESRQKHVDRQRVYDAEHRDENRQRGKRWREQNKDRVRAYFKKWYEENKHHRGGEKRS